MKLQDFRAKLPELNGLDDESALNVLQKVYYPTVDRAKMADVLGVKLTAPAAPEEENRGVVRAAADTALQFGRGAVSGVRMMSDLFGANNAVSGTLKSAEDAIGGLLSAQAQGDQQKIAQIMAEADSLGWKDQIVAGLKAFGVAPGAILAQAAGTSLPTLATALIPGVGAGAVAARVGMGAALGAGQGAGAVKGQIYESVKTELLKSGATPEVAEARAQEAQAYDGANAGQIALGGGLGLVAGTTGAERALSALRNGVTKAAPGMAGRVAMGALTEALPEAAQGGQEKFASNTALVNEGYGIDPTRGVVASATMEGVAGAGMGGAFALPSPGLQTNPAVDDPKKKAADTIRATEKVPETGALTKAVNAGTEAKAQRVETGAPVVTADDVAQAAQRRLAELEAKSKGTKDQTITGPEGEKVNVPGKPGEFFTAEEKAEYDTLKANIDNPQALAQQYGLEIASPQAAAAGATPPAPPVAQPPATPVAPQAAEPPVVPVDQASAEDRAIYDQQAEDEARARAEAEMERLAIQSEGQFGASPPDDDSDIPGFDAATDTLNPAGKPFKTKMAADREAKARGGEVVPVEGGFIVRAKQPGGEDVSKAGGTGAVASGTGGELGADPVGGQPDAGLLDASGGRVPEGTAGTSGPAVQAGDAAPVSGQRDSNETLTADVKDQPQGTAAAAPAPTQPEAQQEAPAVGGDGTAQSGAAPAGNASVEAAGVAQADLVEHTTKKGKRLRGVIRTDMTLAEAKAIDEFAFKKDGGVFIREEHVGKLPPVPAENAGNPGETPDEPRQKPETTPAKADLSEAAAQWTRTTTADRMALALAAGMKTNKAAELHAKKGWDQIDPLIQANLAKAMANPKAPTAPAPALDLKGKKKGDMLEMGNGTQYRVEGLDDKTGRIRATRSPDMLSERSVLLGQDEYDRLLADHEQTMAEAKATPAPAAEPAPAPAPSADGSTIVGRRKDGVMIRKDKNGVRFYTEGGIRISETVELRPTRQGMQMAVGELKRDFMTAEEFAEAFPPKADAPAPAPAAAPAPTQAPAPAPATDELAEREKAAKAKMLNAAAKLADLLSKNTRANITPEQEQAMLPIAIELFEGAMELGYVKFKQAARYVRQFIANAIDQDAADSLPVDTLQGAYIAVSRRHKDKAITPKAEVITVDSTEEIDAEPLDDPTQQEDNSATPADRQTDEGPQNETLLGANNDTGRNADRDTGVLDDQLSTAGAQAGQGTDARGSDGVREDDAPGNGQPEGNRAGRGDGLDGGPQPALSEAAAPGGLNPGRVSQPGQAPAKLTGENPGNFTITEDFGLGEGTDGQKIEANLMALRTLRKIQAEGRYATREEQAIMARYVGWGGLKTVFDPKKAKATDQYGRAQRELKQMLSQAEYRAAAQSIRNAHYTAKPVVDAMWRAVRLMGFKGGRALEPTVGIGNFLGLMPADMAASTEWHASELDTVTGQMAALLYPDANVLAATGFQDAPFADEAFDLSIGNPPFGQETIDDKSKRRQHLSGMKVHNYIIGKTGMHLRPGGVMSMVVTHRFLDTANPEARDVLAKDFKFLGAFRLPNDAFAANAGTEVVTDVIFLQKLRPDEARERDAAWLDVNGEIEVDGVKLRVNRYYQENPSHILGRSANDGTMYAGRQQESGGEYTVHSDGRDLGAAIDGLLAGGLSHMKDILVPTNADMSAAPAMLTQSDLPVGGVMLDGEGRVMRRAMDDAMGNAVVEEITPETLWKEQAAEWQYVLQLAQDIKTKASKGLKPSQGDQEDMIGLSRFAYKADGTPKSNPTKAEQAVYALVDAMAKPDEFAWKYDEQIDTIAAALARKKLGDGGYAALKGMLDLRNRTLGLIRAEMTNAEDMEALRADLNKAYDAFVKAHGYLSDPSNANLLEGDVGVESGLEHSFKAAISPAVAKSTGAKPRKASAEKSDILQRRVNFPYKEVTTADSPADALNVSLSERGRVDLPYMAKLVGKSTADVIKALTEGDNPQLFLDPESGEYQEAERYLSGNVRHKLQEARKAGKAANVQALLAVQPAPKTKAQVTPNIRGMWMPTEVFQQFLEAMGGRGVRITAIPSQGILTGSAGSFQLTEFGTQFRSPERTPDELFNAAASGKAITIMRSANGETWKDEAATKAVNALVERMAKVFQEWAYSDEGRAKSIVDAFNEKMNTHVPRTYDGTKYLKQVGANPSIKLRRTQKNAAWRMIQEKTMLADHVVGAGKTYTVITGIMERRRLRLSRKPMVAVPNHLVVQWARDFYRLYPGAKVLAATPADFTSKNRRRLFARIATGDYDAIIVGHTSIGFMPTPDEDLAAIVNEKLAGLREALETARLNNESKRTLGQMETRIDKYEKKLKELQDRKTDAIGIDFKAMGVDYLAVDEAHEFKNLEYSTSGERVVGMNDPNGSKKAFDLYAKVRGLLGRDGGVAFATGTPVSNSLVEIYTVMSYLAHAELKLRNQEHFDAWSGAYAATETRLEYTATQKLKPRRVLAGLNNLSALRQLYEQFADIITMDDLKRMHTEDMVAKNKAEGTNERTDFPVPKVASGGRVLDSGDITPTQREYMDYLVARMDAIERNKSDKEYARIDNALNVMTDARKMSLDIRIVDPRLPRDENGKVMRAANNIKATYDKWDADRGTQLVFCDLSTPAKTAAKEAGRLVNDALLKLFGKDGSKIAKRRIDGMTFEKRWEWIKAAADELVDNPQTTEERRDEISTYMAEIEDAEATMSVADIGFSVYDDLRAVLMDKGIPESEIAFIHDYNTPAEKEKLFERVNEGYVRVLIGSSAKMGAGTNAQRRLVALHHLDAPWRPSDVEQREGRIIRQQNMLYERDPDGFEVEIKAYSTNNTSDTVMWQILERKAAAIEQFRLGGIDAMEEEGGDSDQYAEFMASSTGNPVFRYKLEAERRQTELEAEISGALISKANAQSFLSRYKRDFAELDAYVQAFSGVEPKSVSYGGLTGTEADFNAATEAALADYAEKKAAFDVRKVEAQAAIAAWEQMPEATRGKKPATPVAPSRPTLTSKVMTDQSAYARVIAQVLDEAKPSKTSRIDLGNGAYIVIEADQRGESRVWVSTLHANGTVMTLGISAAERAADGANLVASLAPSFIRETIRSRLGENRSRMEDLNRRHPIEKKRAMTEVDTGPRDRAREEVRWFAAQVEFAEVQADIERGDRPNRFIAADKRRALAKQSKVQLQDPKRYEREGEVYVTTGIVAGNKEQAVRQRDQEPVVIVLTPGQKQGETNWSVMVKPGGARDLPKSTNLAQTGAPEANDTDVVFSRSANAAPGLYSALSREIEALPTKAAPAVGWKQAVLGLVKAGKVKADEVEWSGLNDWLTLQTGKVTKESVTAYLDANGVQVEEVTLGGDVRSMDQQRAVADLERLGYRIEDEYGEGILVSIATGERYTMGQDGFEDEDGEPLEDPRLDEVQEVAEVVGQFMDGADDAGVTPPKYDRYTLPGGANYREVLLTLPTKYRKFAARYIEGRGDSKGYWVVAPTDADSAGQGFGRYLTQAEAEREAARRTEIAASPMQQQLARGQYASSHWDQMNVLAHIRINDRTDADGKRVLFVEEIQSDWGQEGKKRGFATGDDVVIEAKRVGPWSPNDPNGPSKYRMTVDGKDAGYVQGQTEQEAIERLRSERRSIDTRVPNAPFVTKTDGWLNLALKRVMAMAVDGGYDRVAFVTGDQSAERYDLSKQVDSARIVRYFDGRYGVFATIAGSSGNEQRITERGGVEADKLEDFIGKELAQKAVRDLEGKPLSTDPAAYPKVTYSGLDLKVGGEGMRAFYNQIVPNAVKALLKKVGGGQMASVMLPSTEGRFRGAVSGIDVMAALGIPSAEQSAYWRNLSEDQRDKLIEDFRQRSTAPSAQPGFDVTPAMADKVAGGLPMFAKGGKAGGINPQAAQQIVDTITERWDNAPAVVVLADMNDPRVPESVRKRDAEQRSGGAKGNPEGFFYKGTAYVVASSINTPADVVRVLFHESLGHYGLRGVFGDGLKPILAQLASLRKTEVEAKAKEYGLDMADEAQRLQAAEEVLAVMAQTKPDLGYVKRAVAAVRAWLRKAMPKLFGQMKLTDDEIIQQFILPARRFVQSGPGGGPRGGLPAMSRDTTNSDAGGIIRVVELPAGAMGSGITWVVTRNIPNAGTQHLGYYGTEADAREAAERERVEAKRSAGAGARWWVTDPAEPIQSASLGKLDSLGRARALKSTLDARKDGIKSFDEGINLEQLPDRAGFCFKLAAEASAAGVGDMVIGIAENGGDPVWHAVVQRDGAIYDPTFGRWFEPGVYESLGFKGHTTLTGQAVQDYIARSGGYAPDARRLGLKMDKPGDGDPAFSRSIPKAMAAGVNNVRDMKLPAGYVVNDFFKATGKLSWWHKSIGTQYNLAQRSAPFKRVFDTAQEFINDVSFYATEAADKAKTILPKLESLKDITKSPLSAADNKAIAAPIFEGTLIWVRGTDGKPIKVEELREKAKDITIEKKAQQLVRDNKLTPGVLRMWQGLPIAQYEALIESRYESQIIGRPGIVFTKDELKSMFGLNDKQVGLYREFRSAVDTSLKNMALAELVRLGGEDAAPIADVILESRTVGQAADTLRDYLLSLTELSPRRARKLKQVADTVLDKAAKVKDLMDRGYAPLSRFGSNSLDVVDENGERVYFGLFESKAEANKMARQMLEQFPKATVRQGTMSGEEFKLFAGVSPETVELFGEMLGLDATGDNAKDLAFQEYLKLSKASRSAMTRLIHRKGIAGFSEDPGRVLAGFVYSNARQTSSSLHMGALTEAVNDIPQGQGELKDAAVRLHDYVKNPQEEAQAIRGLLFAQYLGGSIASAIVNMTQPLNVTFPWLSQYGGATKAGAQMARAMRDVLKKSTGDKALDEALKHAEEDGTVSPQEVFQLQAQAAGRASLKAGDGTMSGDLAAKGSNALSKLSLAWGKLFSTAEQFNRRTTFIAAYRTAVEQKMGKPAEFARKAVYETQFVYSKANKPRWARGAVGGTLFTFKQYSIAYVELLHRMATQGGPEGKRAALLALAVLMMLSGVGGLPFAGDVDDLVDGVMQRLGYNFSSHQAKVEFFEGLLGKAGAQIAMRGISGVAGVPIDVSGRLGMSNLLPGTGLLTKKDNYGSDLAEVVGPAGDLAKRVFQATEQALSGEVGKAAVTISPLAARNAAKAVEMGQTGMYLDTRGKKVIEVDGADVAAKAIGFQPNNVARVQNANWDAQRMVGVARLREREIADKWAKGVFLGDAAMVKEAREALTEWNRKNPESPIKIKMPQIVKRVREMRTSKSDRIAKTAPKEIRAQVKDILADANQ